MTQKDLNNKIPIYKGCSAPDGCFCTGKCKEIIGYLVNGKIEYLPKDTQFKLDSMNTNLIKELAVSKCPEITEQIAIEFAEWASKYDWVFLSDRNVWGNDDMKIPVRSSKKLFAEFLKTKQ